MLCMPIFRAQNHAAVFGNPPAKPIFDNLADQEILTVSVARSITVTAPGDATVELFADAVSIGTATNNGDGTHTISWTPSATNYDVDFYGVGNASGESEHLTLVVAEANRILQTLASWSKSNASITITGGQTDPDGGSNAYKVAGYTATNTEQNISRTTSSNLTSVNAGFEIWAKPDGCNVLQIYPFGPNSDSYGYINLVTGESRQRRTHIKIVERRGDWVRIWLRLTNQAGTGSWTFRLALCDVIFDSTPDITAGEGIIFYEPRTADDALPFTDYQKLAVYKTATSGNIETWSYTHPFINSVADVELGMYEINVIKPSGWSASNTYPVLFALPALNKASENVANVFDSGGYASAYGCVIVIPYFKTGIPWYGRKNDGTADEHAFTAGVLPGFATEFLACSADREQRLLIGYSKSANGAYSLVLRNPTVFGYASAWDGVWTIDWATQNVTIQLNVTFGTEAQWQIYDPYTILTSYLSSVNDKQRLSLRGYETWQSDQTDMQILLNANSIQFSYDATDTGNHSFGGGWLSAAVADLFDMAGL
jgi:S-formylglutathione hydrolase FrmB